MAKNIICYLLFFASSICCSVAAHTTPSPATSPSPLPHMTPLELCLIRGQIPNAYTLYSSQCDRYRCDSECDPDRCADNCLDKIPKEAMLDFSVCENSLCVCCSTPWSPDSTAGAHVVGSINVPLIITIVTIFVTLSALFSLMGL